MQPPENTSGGFFYAARGEKMSGLRSQPTTCASFLIFFAQPLWTITEKDLHIVRAQPMALIFPRSPPFAHSLRPLGGGSAKRTEKFS